MTRVLAAAIVTLAALVPASAAPPSKILFIGNSLTTVNDLPRLVEALSNGTMVCRTVAFNDHSLEDHWNRPEARKAIAEGGWSTVILQQGPSALPESRALLIEYVKKFDGEIRKVGARTAIYTVWPSWQRRADFDAVIASHAAAAKEVKGILLPVGEAWQQVWLRDEKFLLYGLDGFHPTPAASYLAATVIYSALSGQPAAALPPLAGLIGPQIGVTPSQTYLLQSAADAALTAHAEVFPSPRLAAVSFALAHGLAIPRTNLVVANDVRFGGINDVPVQPNDRSTKLPVDQTVADSTRVAALLGPRIRTAWANTVLTCPPRQSQPCYTSTDADVLLVEEIKNNDSGVSIKFFPAGGAGQRMSITLVEISKRGDGWIATGFGGLRR